MDEKWRKFFAFEGIIFVIFGIFWPGAMFLPLFLNDFFKNPILIPHAFWTMAGPYLFYLAGRVLFLLYCSLRWAYLVSNFFFKSEFERKVADQWVMFVMLFILWSFIMLIALNMMKMLTPDSWFFVLGVLAGPYLLYLLGRRIARVPQGLKQRLVEK